MVGVGRVLRDVGRDGGGLTATVPEPWLQGRTCYGGLSTALAYAAARDLADDLPPLRTASVSFISPLAGEVQARAELVRRGRSTAFIDADVSGEGGIGLKAGFVFMAERELSVRHDDTPIPDSIDPEAAMPALNIPRASFAQNFEWRHARPEPRSGLPDLLLWVRLREREDLDPTAELLAVADALPPGAMPLFAEQRPISSINWMINLLAAHPSTTDGWWLLRSQAHHVAGGFSSQHMTVWNRDRLCVAQGMQSVAIF